MAKDKETPPETPPETKPETAPEAKHKVKFVSTLYTYDFRFNSGDIAELTAEQYKTAKKYNSIVVYNG